jgi:hypothetical protein
VNSLALLVLFVFAVGMAVMYLLPLVMAISSYMAFKRGRFLSGWIQLGICTVLLLKLVDVFAERIPGYVLSGAEKRGQIVDAGATKGIPGAYVVVDSDVHTEGFMVPHVEQFREYRLIVTTDSEGKYSLPSQWSKISLSFPQFGIDVTREFHVEVFSPGYVYQEDACCMERFAQGLGSQRSVPASHRSDDHLEMDPIFMSTTEVLPQAVTYYLPLQRALVQHLQTAPTEPDEAETRVKTALYDFMLARTCGGDALTNVSHHTASRLISVSPNFEAATSELAIVEPDGFEIMPNKTVQWTAEQLHPTFLLGSVCKAMRAGGVSP